MEAALRRRLDQRRGRARADVDTEGSTSEADRTPLQSEPASVSVHIYDVTGNGAVQQLNQSPGCVLIQTGSVATTLAPLAAEGFPGSWHRCLPCRSGCRALAISSASL